MQLYLCVTSSTTTIAVTTIRPQLKEIPRLCIYIRKFLSLWRTLHRISFYFERNNNVRTGPTWISVDIPDYRSGCHQSARWTAHEITRDSTVSQRLERERYSTRRKQIQEAHRGRWSGCCEEDRTREEWAPSRVGWPASQPASRPAGRSVGRGRWLERSPIRQSITPGILREHGNRFLESGSRFYIRL